MAADKKSEEGSIYGQRSGGDNDVPSPPTNLGKGGLIVPHISHPVLPLDTVQQGESLGSCRSPNVSGALEGGFPEITQRSLAWRETHISVNSAHLLAHSTFNCGV